DEDAGARGAGRGLGGRGLGRRRPRTAAARTLAVEPRIDVALAEAPLPADADCRNLARFDQAIHGPQVHLQVLEDFFGGEKCFVDHAMCSRTGGAAVGSSTVNTAPPSG